MVFYNEYKIEDQKVLQNLLMRPQIIEIESVNRCNAKCVFCIYKDNTPSKTSFMEESLFRSVVDQIAILGTDEFILVPMLGDPLLDLRVLSFLEYARLKVTIKMIRFVTNGLALDKYSEDELMDLLGYIDRMEISIAPNKELYYALFGVDRFEHLLFQLERLANAFEKCKKQPKSIRLMGRSNSNENNIDPKLVALNARFGNLDDIKWLTEYSDWGGQLGETSLVSVIRTNKTEPVAPCIYAFAPHVYVVGSVGLCACAGASEELIIGNLADKSWDELMVDDKRLKMIESFLHGKMPSYCSRCTFYQPSKHIDWKPYIRISCNE